MIPSEYELAHNDPERDSLERLEREWAAEDATPGGVDEVRYDGLVFRNPCVECGDVCQGHGGFLRDADGASIASERSPCGHLVAEIKGREGGTRWCAGCEREARVREEAVEAAARVAEDACDDPPWAIAERIRALAGDRPR